MLLTTKYSESKMLPELEITLAEIASEAAIELLETEALASKKDVSIAAIFAEKEKLAAIKKLHKEYTTCLDKVDNDQYKETPNDWKKIEHISELALAENTVCTRYYFDENRKYPNFVVLVGRTWYTANTQLFQLLKKSPALPFHIKVTDSDRKFKEQTVWNVAISPVDAPTIPAVSKSQEKARLKSLRDGHNAYLKLVKVYNKLLLTVELKKDATSPKTAQKSRYIWDLERDSTEYCTRYYKPESTLPNFFMLVDNAWYVTDGAMSELLENKPPLPFAFTISIVACADAPTSFTAKITTVEKPI